MSNPIDIETFLPTLDIVPTEGENSNYHTVKISPPGAPLLRYSFVLPKGWFGWPELQSQNPAISSTDFFTLGVFSPRGQVQPVFLSFGAIRASDKLTVEKFFEAYCEQAGYSIDVMRSGVFLAGRVIDGLVRPRFRTKTNIMVRMVMFENGGHLFVLGAMAPSDQYLRFIRQMSLGLISFELYWPMSRTLPLR